MGGRGSGLRPRSTPQRTKAYASGVELRARSLPHSAETPVTLRGHQVALLLGSALVVWGSPARADLTEAARRWPWPSAHAGRPPPPPSFLDTTDRRIRGERPPPASDRVKALRELEAEAERFGRIGGAYRDTLASLLKREYQRKRREREEEFSTEITMEEKAEDQARLAAIERFERFLEKYPDDPEVTPDAMFRLGELYFERDAIAQQAEMEAYLSERDRLMEKGLATDQLTEPEKTFTATVNLYRDLVKRFRAYPRRDGVYYLIGYCLNEMAKTGEARLAWLNLVCENHFQYTGEEPSPEGDDAADALAKEHPALGLDASLPAQGVVGDPYKDCKPVVEDSKFYAETWLRIGEYHFDFDFTPKGLSLSISAYRKVMERPEDRNFNLALYKVAWAFYRASHYPEAIEYFGKLVDWSDAERQRTGKGSELRDEAIQYLAIAFSYDDWNENQVPDPSEGMPRGAERVQNPTLMAQDKGWTADVYYRLGSIYFDEAKYPEAIEIWRLALSRWGLARQAPEIQDQIGQAYQRNNMFEEAIVARAKLSDYGEGSDWWEANKDHPVEQRRAEQLAEEALINTAVVHHQLAQRQRRQCVENQDPSLCDKAQVEYGLAATAYRAYIAHYPNNPQAYELQYNLADALYWAGAYEEAAREYTAVRDSNLDDRYLSVAARLVVEATKRVVEAQEKTGAIPVRTEPPNTEGAPSRVTVLEVPPLVQQLAHARELYLARVDEEHDSEKVRASYDYNNALILYVYGYWDLARERFWRIFAEHCRGATADETGKVSWLNLRNMAVALNQTDEVRRLGAELSARECTFVAGATKIALNCAQPENKDAPQCIAGQDLTNLRYREAVEIFARAEQAQGYEQRRLFEWAATELVKAVNDEPKHPQAPLALEKAAIALERTSRFESAGRLYQRIIDEVGPRKGVTPEEQAQFDAILANAYFRLAFNANRFFDYDRAVENYRMLADSKRFEASTDPRIPEWREGALINAAKILEYRQEYARAAEYYTRAAALLRDPAEARAARYRIAEMAYKLEQWQRATTEMRTFIDRYRNDKDAGELVVQAYARIAEARQALKQTREYNGALLDVVSAFERSGQKPGTYAAEYAAQSRFQLVDPTTRDFETFAIKAGNPTTLKSYVDGVTSQIETGSRQAKQKAEAYNIIPPYRRPTWTIAAFVRQGRIYEVLARAVLNTPFVVPGDLQKKMKGLPQESKDEIKVQVEDAIRQVLDAKVRPIECLAVARYALAVRAARAGNLDNEYTREASDRINAYGDERIAECVAQAAAQDATFQAYTPGEFARAPRGQHLDIPAGVAPAPLSVTR